MARGIRRLAAWGRTCGMLDGVTVVASSIECPFILSRLSRTNTVYPLRAVLHRLYDIHGGTPCEQHQHGTDNGQRGEARCVEVNQGSAVRCYAIAIPKIIKKWLNAYTITKGGSSILVSSLTIHEHGTGTAHAVCTETRKGGMVVV